MLPEQFEADQRRKRRREIRDMLAWLAVFLIGLVVWLVFG